MKRMSPNHQPARDEASIRRPAAAFDWIARWRREILRTVNVSETTTRTMAQLSDFELALYLAGKKRREKSSKLARRDLFNRARPAAAS